MEDHDAYDQPLPEYPEAVRMRPGMYIGDTGVRGLHHLFKEIIDSSMDEVLNGHCTRIDVVLGEDYVTSVRDNGRGISTERDPLLGKSVLELVLTDFMYRDSPHDSTGPWRTDASCVNALSEWLECTTRRDGEVYRMQFERGVPVSGPEMVGRCDPDEHGTTVTWLTDKTVLKHALDDDGNLAYDGGVISRNLREMAYLLPAARITFHDRLRGKPLASFHFPSGIADRVRDRNAGHAVFPAEPITIHGVAGDVRVSVALQYRDDDTETVESFANTRPTPGGGTHATGFLRALTRAANGLSVPRTRHGGEAIRRGLRAVVSVTLAQPGFNSSDATRLFNLELEGIVFAIVFAGLKEYFKNHPDDEQRMRARLVVEEFPK